MSRATDLLRKAADALDDGRDPLTLPFLSDNDVTLDECYEMAENLASGALILSWVMDNPQKASTMLRGGLDEMKLQALIGVLRNAMAS